MQIELGKKIRELRRREGRTQEMLAEALGVTSQAVSRWESGGSYPDMNLIPSIANYFGVTIDELFGYHNEREKKIDALAAEITQMKRKNNGIDINISQTIEKARSALVEFPGNERLMVCLASVLYTAGYVRHGEYHLSDAEGYDIYDTQRHSEYSEWKEAVSLYEKALRTLEEGDLRRVAVGELMQLYVNMGQHEKAIALADAAPTIYSTREYMRISACDGKKRVQANGKALLDMLHACAAMMVQGVLASRDNMEISEKVQTIRSAIGLFDAVCTDGNYGEHNRLIARMYILLSFYLWLAGEKDEAFEALDCSLTHFRQFGALCAKEDPCYTAPLIRQIPLDFSRCAKPDPSKPDTTAASLYRAWPWWRVAGEEEVREEMQKDPRWDAWVRKCEES